jgi:integrase
MWYCKANRIDWQCPRIRARSSPIAIPTEERIDKIISAGNQKWTTIFSISKHGLRPDEVSKITLRDVDLQRGLLTVRTSKLGAARDLKLSFEASGPDGTSGYVKITIAKSLVTDIENIEVKLDGENSTFSIISLADSWLLKLTYEHSTHQIEVDIDITVVPDLSAWFMLLAFIIATAAIAIQSRKD